MEELFKLLPDWVIPVLSVLFVIVEVLLVIFRTKGTNKKLDLDFKELKELFMKYINANVGQQNADTEKGAKFTPLVDNLVYNEKTKLVEKDGVIDVQKRAQSDKCNALNILLDRLMPLNDDVVTTTAQRVVENESSWKQSKVDEGLKITNELQKSFVELGVSTTEDLEKVVSKLKDLTKSEPKGEVPPQPITEDLEAPTDSGKGEEK